MQVVLFTHTHTHIPTHTHTQISFPPHLNPTWVSISLKGEYGNYGTWGSATSPLRMVLCEICEQTRHHRACHRQGRCRHALPRLRPRIQFANPSPEAFYFLKSVWLRAECLELFWFDKVFVCCGLILIWVFANFMIFSVRHFFHIQFHGFDFCCGELCISNLWFLLESLMCCVLIQFGILAVMLRFLICWNGEEIWPWKKEKGMEEVLVGEGSSVCRR